MSLCTGRGSRGGRIVLVLVITLWHRLPPHTHIHASKLWVAAVVVVVDIVVVAVVVVAVVVAVRGSGWEW